MLTVLMRFRLLRKSLWKFAALVAVWTAYGLFSGWETHYRWSFSKNPLSWADSIWYELSYAYLWCLCTPLVVWLSNRYMLGRHPWRRNAVIHIAGMTVLTILTGVVWLGAVNPPTSPFRYAFSWSKLFRSVEALFDTGMLLYWVVVLMVHAYAYYRYYEEGVLSSSKLQTQLVRSQLESLKMRLHPHFLFNTLHTIAALIHEDPDLAERTIARLSDLLRHFLANSETQEVPLSEELRVLDMYLEIERTRFGDRLVTRFDIEPAAYDAMVPNLVLQPLVENALRHGLSKRSYGGKITISADRIADTLVLRVMDNGVGLSGEKKSNPYSGMGLGITRGRLETLYGTRQSLRLRNLPEGGVEARIVMPFQVSQVNLTEEVNWTSKS